MPFPDFRKDYIKVIPFPGADDIKCEYIELRHGSIGVVGMRQPGEERYKFENRAYGYFKYHWLKVTNNGIPPVKLKNIKRVKWNL